ncbi:MAG: aromatic ring-hydroxylating oxygenase subunit alpha [Acidimicrobiia bacterium]
MGTTAFEQLAWPEADNQIPREIFTDPDVFAEELDRLWQGPVWHVLGHAADVPNPGDFLTTTLGNVPIIVVRGGDDVIRVLLNVCAHRSNQVEVCPRGSTRGFTCIYHTWQYALDGRLTGFALREDYPESFKMEDYGLPGLRCETRSGVIFAAFPPDAPDLDEFLGAPLLRALDETFVGEMEYAGQQRWRYQGNWKLFAENMYDGYHARALHRGLRYIGLANSDGGFCDPEGGRPHTVYIAVGSNPSVNLAETLHDPQIFEVRTKERTDEGVFTNWLVNVFPAGVCMSNWDLITIRRVIPLSAGETEVIISYYVPVGEPEEITRHRIVKASNLYGPSGVISLEDTVAFERTQRGATGRGTHNILKGAVRQNPPYRRRDEAHMRHFYKAYRAVMQGERV